MTETVPVDPSECYNCDIKVTKRQLCARCSTLYFFQHGSMRAKKDYPELFREERYRTLVQADAAAKTKAVFDLPVYGLQFNGGSPAMFQLGTLGEESLQSLDGLYVKASELRDVLARTEPVVTHVNDASTHITWDAQGRRLVNGVLGPEHR